ncbi:MAG TPA: alkaline phosphatase family protein [Puia sp.]|uniref:alkaline phosphatase family protein n=1 Tax=Puia sp. TaxID=2045100 RepID=UPI002C25A222|nr:alkaline phosphatase family protein [Puia sp.]HVU95448.1 alkaline phosphatase family protein [Puia sp.]
MPGILDQVNSIVLVMMENRSFDHFLGSMTLQDPALDINGLRQDSIESYNNVYNGTAFPIYERGSDDELPFDVPHEWNYVQTQLAPNSVSGNLAMNGFVTAYALSTKTHPNPQCEPMGYFPEKFLPMTRWLAKNFAVCDNWYCPIPTSTQPNRTMAFSGDTGIFETKTQLIDIPNDIFGWLDNHDVNWRVYHEAFSFFALYPSLWPHVLSGRFKRYENLYADIINDSLAESPQLTIIEPIYEDAPHFGGRHPDDNHAPLAVSWGEDFIRRTYQAITANPDKWKGTLMILYYDEHGGFYDHVAPPQIPYTTNGDNPHSFTTLGPRIPAILVSPLIKPGSPCHLLLDHTSVLQLLVEKFGKSGEPWSPTVDQRRQAGIRSISEALNNPQPFPAPQEPNVLIPATPADLGKSLTVPPQTAMGQAFETAGLRLLAEQPTAKDIYPELVQWQHEAAKSSNT